MTEETENLFEVAQAELIEKFKTKMRKACNEVLSDVYVDISFHAVSDAHINFKNAFRDEVTKEFREEIISDYGHYSWAHNMRMLLLKNHREDISNKIIEDLQEKIKSLEEHIEQLRKWR